MHQMEPHDRAGAAVPAEGGFTLVELMIALFISALLMAAVVTVHTTQTRSYTRQDDIADIQQNLRGALAVMPMEIRMAGCDPEQTGKTGILQARSTFFQFTRDYRSGTAPNVKNRADGDIVSPDEIIAFGLAAGADTNSDGIVDNGRINWSGTSRIGRQSGAGGGLQPLADNIEALEFQYILKNGTQTLSPAAADLRNIRMVQLSILARTSIPDQAFAHAARYTTASGTVWTPPADNFRRRLAVVNIQLRNMGYR